jgi:arylsulfatase
MDRRTFIKGMGLAIAGLSLRGTASAAQGAKRPNIILIMSDDMGFSDLGCYGGEIRTPNLDRLAADGLRFTQFYNTARCCPTRASLMTGLHPHQAGVGHMERDEKLEGYRGHLGPQSVTIAEVLKTAGYGTYLAGKWHLSTGDTSERTKAHWPVQRGFDRFYGTLRGAVNFYDPVALTRDNTLISAYNDPEYKPEKYYFTHAISDHAARFIDDHLRHTPDKPFFAYVAYTAPHWPMQALQKDIAKYTGQYDQGYAPIRRKRFERMKELGIIGAESAFTPTVGDWDACEYKPWEARCMEVYAAMVDAMDQGIGKIIGTLKEHDQLDNTIIIYLQDNGGCAEDLGRNGPKDWQLEGIEPMTPEQFQTQSRPPMRTRDGRPVLGGKQVMPGPEDTYIAYGENWANVSNTPYKEYKHWVHEGGIATPLIVHWPAGLDKSSRGKLRRQPGQLPDIMATCVDVAGAQYPNEYKGNQITPLQGVSLKPAFNSDASLEREALYWEHEGNRAIRIGDWKLVSRADARARLYDGVETLKIEDWELYDMSTDRSEQNNLAAKHPDRVREMAAQWQAWANRSLVYPKPPRQKF